MLNVVKKLWKRSVRVTLKRPDRPGLTYAQLMDLLAGLRARNGRYSISIDAQDLTTLLRAHAASEIDKELSMGVKTSEGYVPKLVAMWGEEKETHLGMKEWLEIVPVPGLNISCIYRLHKCCRTGL